MPAPYRIFFLAQVVLSLLAPASLIQAARDNHFVVTHKYSSTTDGYFSTPHLVKARAYWEVKKTIDLYDDATISVADQVGYAAGSQTADVVIPHNIDPAKPVGIYIHINASDSAHLPSNLESVLQDNYLIGASPDNAGNNRHDPERCARVLDLVTTLKARYNVDDSRVYVGGFSGGALASVLCGMLYPDTFTGVIATEHVMDSRYWRTIFTREDMDQMAANGQRWSHILGEDSYAASVLFPWSVRWKYHITVDHSVDPVKGKRPMKHL